MHLCNYDVFWHSPSNSTPGGHFGGIIMAENVQPLIFPIKAVDKGGLSPGCCLGGMNRGLAAPSGCWAAPTPSSPWPGVTLPRPRESFGFCLQRWW